MKEHNLGRLQRRLQAARGQIPADLLLKGGTLLNVLSGSLEEQDVAVFDGVVVGFGSYQAREIIEVGSGVVCPSFWDAHFHLESSMLTPAELARVAVPAGTGTIVADPHEIANVLGLPGIRFLLEASQDLPLDFYFMLPSCVPATDMETAGARIEAPDLLALKDHPRVLGLAEVMNFPAVVQGEEGVLQKVLAFGDEVVDGHAPLLGGADLNAYLTAGIASDHECSSLEEARDKLSRGMYIMIRQGTLARNLEQLLPLVTPLNSRRMMLVTDDRHPEELLEQGHMNHVLREAVRLGLDPVVAVQMATINPAQYLGLRRRGAVAPGYRADLLVLKDLHSFSPQVVIKEGRVVWREGHLLEDLPSSIAGASVCSMRVESLSRESFAIPARGTMARVIELVPGQLITRQGEYKVKQSAGLVLADPEQDVLKVAVVERHQGTGNVGLGLVRGLGLKQGALCSSVAHDSHNLVAVGVDDSDLLASVQAVVEMGGGQVAVREGRVLAKVPLRIAGLMSYRPARELVQERRKLFEAARSLGCPLEDPFMAMSFLALPVIPWLKITDRGLVDVEHFRFVPLFLD